jgi:predicted GNAT family N-acyltransferase
MQSASLQTVSFTDGDMPGVAVRPAATGEVHPVHGPVLPADVRAGDPILAHVRPVGGAQKRVASRVWRISPFGVELVRPRELDAVEVGMPIDLTLRVGTSVSDFRALRVVSTASERGHDLVSLSWGQVSNPDPRGERRGTARWACEKEYAPTGIAPNAVRYEDFVYFRVVDISWSGMQLETSLRNKFLIPGVTLKATCTFPTQGQVRLELQVVHVRVVQRGQKRVLSVGARVASQGDGSEETIGQYLLQFGNGATVKELCAEGFRIPSSSGVLDFGSLRTPEEYGEVLRLRRLAYVHAKKLGEDTKDLDMADAFDARSRILVAKHRGRVVGTVRLMFPQSEADRLNHEDYMELPPRLPPREQMVEVFKACTHPGYRGSDLFYRLLMHAALTIIQSGRRYALMSATDSLAPLYERFGFRKLGTAYLHPSMKVEHHLMLVDAPRTVSGLGTNPIFWNLAGGWELWSFARSCGVVPGDFWSVARVRFLRLFRPVAQLARLVYSRRLRPR